MHYNYESMPKTYDKTAVDTWIEEHLKQQETVEYHTMLENLEVLKKWCETHSETDFFKFFQDMIIGAYCRALYYKNKVWSAKHESKKVEPANGEKWWEKALNAAMLGAPIILPIVTTLVDLVETVEINMPQFLAAVAVGAGFSVPLGIFKRRKQEEEKEVRAAEEEVAKHKYDETWVRHSLCDARLRLVLSKFASMTNPSKEDYDVLVQNTFAILEQNLDQFAVNLCPNGMAERSNVPSVSARTEEDDDDK